MVCKNALFGANRKETGQMQRYHKQERHFTVGLDLSDKKSYYVILDGDGEVVRRRKGRDDDQGAAAEIRKRRTDADRPGSGDPFRLGQPTLGKPGT